MTDELKPWYIENPPKKGDFLKHPALGVCSYAGKVRRRKDIVTVIYSQPQNMKEIRVNVPLAECTLHKPGYGKQSTRLILVRCVHCDVKIRASRTTLQLGIPRCFNTKCESFMPEHNCGDELITEYGERPENPGKLDVDKSEMARAHNAQQEPRKLYVPKPKGVDVSDDPAFNPEDI
jgi:hypothetical protein